MKHKHNQSTDFTTLSDLDLQLQIILIQNYLFTLKMLSKPLEGLWHFLFNTHPGGVFKEMLLYIYQEVENTNSSIVFKEVPFEILKNEVSDLFTFCDKLFAFANMKGCIGGKESKQCAKRVGAWMKHSQKLQAYLILRILQNSRYSLDKFLKNWESTMRWLVFTTRCFKEIEKREEAKSMSWAISRLSPPYTKTPQKEEAYRTIRIAIERTIKKAKKKLYFQSWYDDKESFINSELYKRIEGAQKKHPHRVIPVDDVLKGKYEGIPYFIYRDMAKKVSDQIDEKNILIYERIYKENEDRTNCPKPVDIYYQKERSEADQMEKNIEGIITKTQTRILKSKYGPKAPQIIALLVAYPNITQDEIANKLKCSKKTVWRYIDKMKEDEGLKARLKPAI